MSKVCQISLNMREEIYDFAHMMAGEMNMSVAAYVRGLIERERGTKPEPVKVKKPVEPPKPAPTPEAVKPSPAPVPEKVAVEAVTPVVDDEAKAAMREKLSKQLGLTTGSGIVAQPKKKWK